MMMFELSVRAGSITEEQARAKAQSFLQTRRPLLNGKRLAPTQTPTELRNVPTGKTALYVFNVGNNEGFVMVSSSDLVPHVLAYADRGTFDKESLPANMQSWLQGYADQIAYLERTEGKYEAPMLRVQRNAVKTLLNSTWHQDEPYNNKCPIDPSTGNRCVTGCMATAMAQVINYYKYPSQTKAVIPSYTTKEKQISMPEIGITAIDWNNMLDNYNSYATTAQKNAVAQLMFSPLLPVDERISFIVLYNRPVRTFYSISVVTKHRWSGDLFPVDIPFFPGVKAFLYLFSVQLFPDITGFLPDICFFIQAFIFRAFR